MKFYEIKDQRAYQSFVHTNGAFLQDWNWGEFQASQGKKVFRFALENDNGEIILAAQFFKSQMYGKSYLFAPYGPVARTAEDLNRELAHFFRHIKEHFPGVLFIRMEPQLPATELQLLTTAPNLKKTADLDPHQTLILDLAKSDEQLLAEMKQKTRYNIKVAQKHGVEIRALGSDPEAIELFLSTARRAGIRAFSQEYYRKMLEFFEPPKGSLQAQLYTAWHGNELLAANLMIFYQGTAIYLFGGSSDKKRNMMAPYLLHWQAIQDSRTLGMSKYDFWGIEEDPNHPWFGFSKFKAGFGGQLKKYAGTYDYVFSPAWYTIYRAIRKLNRIIRK